MSSTPLFVVNKKRHQLLVCWLIHGGIKQGHLHCQGQPEWVTAADHCKVLSRDMDRKITLSAFTQFLLYSFLLIPQETEL